MSEPIAVYQETYQYDEDKEIARVRITIDYRDKEFIPQSYYGAAQTAHNIIALKYALGVLERSYEEMLQLENVV